MRRYIMYLWYVIRHKWFVFVECVRIGVWWRGLSHDIGKLRPDELVPYAKHFYNSNGTGRDNFDDPAFDKAWLMHIHRNPHHHQYWVLRQDDAKIVVIQMPDVYVREMVADWKGAGKAQGFSNNTHEWYEKNKGKMLLHENTRQRVEELLGLR